MSIREFKQRLADLINESGLPLDILEVILEKFMAEVHLATDHAYAEAFRVARYGIVVQVPSGPVRPARTIFRHEDGRA